MCLFLAGSSGREYYLALGGPLGNRKQQARMKLLLDDYTRQSSFCLKFDYRIQGQNTGVLRVMLDNSAVAVWEKRNPLKRSWQSEQITISWTENTPEAVSYSLNVIIILEPHWKLWSFLNQDTFTLDSTSLLKYCFLI